MSKSEDAAIKLLLKQRKAVIARMAETEEGRELARLEAAIKALGVDPDEQPSARRGRQTTSTSVRSKVKTLLDEAPLRWTIDAIVDTYEQRGDPIRASDARASVRTAIWALQKDLEAERLDDGMVISGVFSPAETEGHFGGASANG